MTELETMPPSRPPPPDVIPGYRLERLVGKGGMGEVHRAVQLSLGRVVAVKLLAGELASDPTFVTRFDKEAAALATLSHPNVVQIVDKGATESTYYLVMEYVDGQSLREVMKSPQLDVPGALRIVMEISRAIDYAHNRGVIHRDLKPENILFDEQAGGIAKVTDFGLATFFDTNLTPRFNVTDTHVSMGTLSYMAPEQRVDAKNADHRADIYSLGVMLYELLVGEVPLGNFDPPSQLRPGIDKRIDPIVARCLKPSPADRYQKVSELMLDLEPMTPITFSQVPRKISRVEQIRAEVLRGLRTAGRVAAALTVAAAVAVLSVSWARTRYHPPLRPQPGAALTSPELGFKSATTVPGRIEDAADHRRVVVGEGPDSIPLIALGRTVRRDGATLSLGPPTADDGDVGRTHLDIVDRDGISAQFVADVTATPPPSGFWSSLKDAVLGTVHTPEVALLFLGGPGRYVAVTVSGVGDPLAFEWALGERRGTMLGAPSPKDGKLHVELLVDRAGQLQAFVGLNGDQRPIGEPLFLGTDWRKHFGQAPTPALGCIDGACSFTEVTYDVGREPPELAALPEPAAAMPARTTRSASAKKTKLVQKTGARDKTRSRTAAERSPRR